VDGLGYACALVLAAVFVRAGAAKLARPAETAAGFAALGVPAAGLLGRAVPFVELLVAAALIAVPRAGGIVALLLLVGFAGLLARAVRAGSQAPCNCFGSARPDPVSSTDIMRDLLLAVLAATSLGATRPTVPSVVDVVVVALAVGAGAGALAASRR
jgi:uncharacterized membrane protein YphA (DoxX/SURF4 family)